MNHLDISDFFSFWNSNFYQGLYELPQNQITFTWCWLVFRLRSLMMMLILGKRQTLRTNCAFVNVFLFWALLVYNIFMFPGSRKLYFEKKETMRNPNVSGQPDLWASADTIKAQTKELICTSTFGLSHTSWGNIGSIWIWGAKGHNMHCRRRRRCFSNFNQSSPQTSSISLGMPHPTNTAVFFQNIV